MFAILGDAANAYNAIAWKDAIPFIAVLIGLCWVKVKIDSELVLVRKINNLKKELRKQ